MAVFWDLLLVISLVGLLVGLIKPSLYSSVFRTNLTRVNAAIIFGAILIVVLILGTVFAPNK